MANLLGALFVGDTLVGAEPDAATGGLSGVSAGSTTVHGFVGDTPPINASAAGSSTVTGRLADKQAVVGSASGQTSVTGRMGEILATRGTANGVATAVGRLGTRAPLTAGTVAGHATVTGSLTNTPAPLSNDAFANAVTLVQGGVYFGSTVGYTKEAGEGGNAGQTAWFRWIAPSTATVQVNLIGSSYDTYLGIWLGSATTADTISTITLVTQDDDAGGNGTSLCNFNTIAGRTYYFQVGGYSTNTGSYQLHYPTGQTPMNIAAGSTVVSGTLGVKHPPGTNNDMFADAIEIYAGGSLTGNNTGYTVEPGEVDANQGTTWLASAWYKWTAPVDATYQFSTVGSSFDTVLGIYTGTTVSNLSRVALDDDSGGNATSWINRLMSAGTYYIKVMGYDSASKGPFVLNYPAGVAPSGGPMGGTSSGVTTVSGQVSLATGMSGASNGRTSVAGDLGSFSPGDLGSATSRGATNATAVLSIEIACDISWYGDAAVTNVPETVTVPLRATVGNGIRPVKQPDISTGAASNPHERQSALSTYYT